MKRTLSLLSFFFVLLSATAQSWPALPSTLGNGRLKVVAQNCQYYFVLDPTNSMVNSKFRSAEGMEDKTNRIAASFVHMDADIYALCEVEVNDSVLHYLANVMNVAKGSNVYGFVADGLRSTSQYDIIKCGYIYRTDRVAPVGNNIAGTNQNNTYILRMRIQAFQETATGEKFVLSMNHFKAQDSSADQGENTRVLNASNLLAKLSLASVTSIDPDILILGDLNETSDKQAVQSLITAGYEEQMLRFDSNAYSYYYNRQYQLIDHALANASMAQQITGAGAFHINTGTSKNGSFWYSDHDALMVAVNLASPSTDLPEQETTSHNNARRLFVNGQLYILREGSFYTLDGRKLSE